MTNKSFVEDTQTYKYVLSVVSKYPARGITQLALIYYDVFIRDSYAFTFICVLHSIKKSFFVHSRTEEDFYSGTVRAVDASWIGHLVMRTKQEEFLRGFEGQNSGWER